MHIACKKHRCMWAIAAINWKKGFFHVNITTYVLIYHLTIIYKLLAIVYFLLMVQISIQSSKLFSNVCSIREHWNVLQKLVLLYKQMYVSLYMICYSMHGLRVSLWLYMFNIVNWLMYRTNLLCWTSNTASCKNTSSAPTKLKGINIHYYVHNYAMSHTHAYICTYIYMHTYDVCTIRTYNTTCIAIIMWLDLQKGVLYAQL